MVLAELQADWVLPALLAVGGLVCLGDAAVEKSKTDSGGAVRFLLNVVSLPLGALLLASAGLEAWAAGHVVLGTGIGLAVGAALAGRSLVDLPWTGAVALVVAVGVGYFLDKELPGRLSFDGLLAVAGIAFLVVYAILWFIELPLRVAGWIAFPRPVLVILAVAAFVGAAVLVL